MAKQFRKPGRRVLPAHSESLAPMVHRSPDPMCQCSRTLRTVSEYSVISPAALKSQSLLPVRRVPHASTESRLCLSDHSPGLFTQSPDAVGTAVSSASPSICQGATVPRHSLDSSPPLFEQWLTPHQLPPQECSTRVRWLPELSDERVELLWRMLRLPDCSKKRSGDPLATCVEAVVLDRCSERVSNRLRAPLWTKCLT